MSREPESAVDRRQFLRHALGVGTLTAIGLTAFGIAASRGSADAPPEDPESTSESGESAITDPGDTDTCDNLPPEPPPPGGE
jgi:hypothetical protein